MSTKFDEAVFFDENANAFSIISLEILNLLKKNNKKEILKYIDNLYCPECRKPRLTLVLNNKTSEYFLRGFPNQLHLDTCSYSFQPAKSKILCELFSDSASKDFVYKKLNNLIEVLFKEKKQTHNPFIICVENNKCLMNDISLSQTIQKKNLYRLPTKSITAPFSVEDYDVYKLFYGNVDINLMLRSNKLTGDEFYTLVLYKKETEQILCNLSMSPTVCSYLKRKYLIEVGQKERDVYIAFATILRSNNSFKNGKIIHSNYCIIERKLHYDHSLFR